jgi:UDP-N-acetylglucosamine 2-epimerase (non-hydrolysing)
LAGTARGLFGATRAATGCAGSHEALLYRTIECATGGLLKLWFILGTAAELIKVFPLMKEADRRGIDWTTVSTGQSAVNFWTQYDDFALPRERACVAVDTGQDLHRSRPAFTWFLRAWRSDPRAWAGASADSSGGNFAVVHGDTLSTLVGAHWGRKLGWPVVHVEAGLRSRRLLSPFPEEITRRLASRWADFHMAPDEWSADNLRHAGYDTGIVNTGANTLVDAVHEILADGAPHDREPGTYVVANLHRFENLKSATRWRFLIDTLERAARDRPVLLVLHPQTRHKIDSEPGLRQRLGAAGVTLVDRMAFKAFIRVLADAAFVISDGGSNQEECFYLGMPCLLLRETTERQVGLGSTCVLTGFDRDAVEAFLREPFQYKRDPWTPERSPTTILLDALASSERSSSTSSR